MRVFMSAAPTSALVATLILAHAAPAAANDRSMLARGLEAADRSVAYMQYGGRAPYVGPGSGTGLGRSGYTGPGSGTGLGRRHYVGPGSGTGLGRRRGIGGGALIGGLAAGALIGGAIASQAAPAPVYVVPGEDAISYCLQRFRSYDPESGTYLGYDGQRHPCP